MVNQLLPGVFDDTSVIGAEAKKEGGAGLVLLQELDEARDAFLRAAQGIDVDL